MPVHTLYYHLRQHHHLCLWFNWAPGLPHTFLCTLYSWPPVRTILNTCRLAPYFLHATLLDSVSRLMFLPALSVHSRFYAPLYALPRFYPYCLPWPRYYHHNLPHSFLALRFRAAHHYGRRDRQARPAAHPPHLHLPPIPRYLPVTYRCAPVYARRGLRTCLGRCVLAFLRFRFVLPIIREHRYRADRHYICYRRYVPRV